MEGWTKTGRMNQWVIIYIINIPIGPTGNKLLGTCSKIISTAASELNKQHLSPSLIKGRCKEIWNFPKIVKYIYGKAGNLILHSEIWRVYSHPLLAPT